MSFNFGSSAKPAGSGGFSFGTPGASAPGGGGGFNFGGGSSTPAGGGGFSFNASTPKTGAGGGFSFGSAAGSGSKFGGGTTGGFGSFGGFGGAGAAGAGNRMTPSLFGTATPAPAGGGGFGSFGTTLGGGGSYFGQQQQKNTANLQQQQLQQLQLLQQQQMLAGGQMPSVLPPHEAMQTLYNAYLAESEFCRFRFMLYNYVDDASKYARPPSTSELLWDQAQRLNPDKQHLVPVEARGFGDLKRRVEQQDAGAADQLATVRRLEQVLTTLEQRYELSSTTRLDEYRRRHRALCRRTLRALRRLAVLSGRGYGANGDEGALWARLDAVYRDWNQPHRIQGRLPELTALLRAQIEQNNADSHGGGGGSSGGGGAGGGDGAEAGAKRKDHPSDGIDAGSDALSPDQLNDVCAHLSDMGTGMKLLVEQVHQNSRELDKMAELIDELNSK